MPVPPPSVSAITVEDDVRCSTAGGRTIGGIGVPGGKTGWGTRNVKSAVRRMLATPPPALKYGDRRVDVVGMSMRAVFVNSTIRPPRFDRVGPGKITTLATEVAPVVRMIGDPVGNSEFTFGTPVASITKLTTRLKR